MLVWRVCFGSEGFGEFPVHLFSQTTIYGWAVRLAGTGVTGTCDSSTLGFMYRLSGSHSEYRGSRVCAGGLAIQGVVFCGLGL